MYREVRQFFNYFLNSFHRVLIVILENEHSSVGPVFGIAFNQRLGEWILGCWFDHGGYSTCHSAYGDRWLRF